MRSLLKLLVLAAVALSAYIYFVPGAYEAIVKSLPLPKKIDQATGRPMVDCPACGATGVIPCTAHGCVDGQVECDGPCLRLTKGRWIKNAQYGKGPDELWFVFPKNKGIAAVTKGHVGEVWEIKDGVATNLGKCKICGGTTRMPCKVCQGTSKATCPTYKGKKEIPEPSHSSSPPSLPVSAAGPARSSTPSSLKPQIIKLKDGTSIEGIIIIRDSEIVVVRTPDGKTTQIPKSNLVAP